jgi:hypothetical protein
MRQAYVGGLGIMDGFLARLFAALDGAKIPDDTITIVCSDHGEAFGEHGYLTHERFLHDEIVRVPLLVRAPGRLPAGAVVRGTCGPVDIPPTILDLVGHAAPPAAFDGRSLVPLAKGKAGGHPVTATADRTEIVGGGPRAVREVRVRDATRVWSYVYDVASGERVDEHVFDLAKDPRMLAPLPLEAIPWPDDDFCAAVTREPRRGAPPLRSHAARLALQAAALRGAGGQRGQPPPPPGIPDPSVVGQRPSQLRTRSSRSDSGTAPWRSTSSWNAGRRKRSPSRRFARSRSSVIERWPIL